MKKKIPFYVLIILVCVIGVSIYYVFSLPNGETIESREMLLDNAISKGTGWTIAKEIEIDNYIISAAYSSNNKSTIAVLSRHPMGNIGF